MVFQVCKVDNSLVPITDLRVNSGAISKLTHVFLLLHTYSCCYAYILVVTFTIQRFPVLERSGNFQDSDISRNLGIHHDFCNGVCDKNMYT